MALFAEDTRYVVPTTYLPEGGWKIRFRRVERDQEALDAHGAVSIIL